MSKLTLAFSSKDNMSSEDIKNQEELEQLFNELIDILVDTKKEDISKLIKVLELYDGILIGHVFDDAIISETKTNAQEYLHNLILKKLNEEIDGEKLGDILIKEYLCNNTLLGYCLILFDFNRVSQELGLEKITPLILEYNPKIKNYGIAHVTDEVIELRLVSLDTLKKRTLNKIDLYNQVIAHNLTNMLTIRHEFRHFIQEQICVNSNINESLEVLYYLFSEKASNIPGAYQKYHDYFPDEIDAISYSAFNLMELIHNKYNSKQTKYSKNLIYLTNYIYYNLLTKLNSLKLNTNPKEITDPSNLSIVTGNMLSPLYEIIDYGLTLIRNNNSNEFYDYYYDMFYCVKIFNQILKMFPNSKVYINYLRKNLTTIQSDPIFIEFEFEKIFENLDLLESLLRNRMGIEFMERLGYKVEVEDKSLISSFNRYLYSKGFNKEQIKNIYQTFYENNKDICDFLYFMGFINNQKLKGLKQNRPTSKNKRQIKNTLHKIK